MKLFWFRNGRVRATFPDSYRLRYERNGYIEAYPDPRARIVFRFSLHPANNTPRPPDSGLRFVETMAKLRDRPLESAGETRFFYEGQDESFRGDGVVIRHWQVGFRSWNVGVSATIAVEETETEAVGAAQAELSEILGSLEETPARSIWSRLFPVAETRPPN